MQLRILVALIIFIGSYMPLSLILLVQDHVAPAAGYMSISEFISDFGDGSLPLKNPLISTSVFLICVICFLFTFSVLYSVKTYRNIKIISSSHVPAEIINYTLPYIVSFMSVGYDEEGKFLGIVIFLGWMFIIVFRSGQIMMNPLLVAFGWRLYNISYSFAGESAEYNGVTLSNTTLSCESVVKYGAIQDVIISKTA